MDWHRKLIIEYEEEAGKKKGAFGAKWGKRGHTEYTNTRDKRRDDHYNKFSMLKIWEHELKDETWKKKLFNFLDYHNRNPINIKV